MPDTSLSSILSPEVPTAPAQPARAPLLTSTLVEPVATVMRPFGDPKAMRNLIFDNVMQAVSQKYPLENSRYQLSLGNLHYRNKSPYTLVDQKKAIMQGNSLDYQLVGDWNLIDKATGKSVDKRPTLVAHVPYATDRGTFIYKGNEYTVANQMRLKPGVFTRVKENGIIEAHFNTKPGTGPSFRLHMEPDTGIFRLNVGQSNLKLYPILKAMGVSDKELEGAWGSELLQTNIQAEDPRAVGRAYAALVSSRADQAVGGSDNEQVEKVACDMHIALDEGEQYAADADWNDVRKSAENLLEKDAKIGAREADLRWSKLWFKGNIRAETGKNGEPWVKVDVHKGLLDAAFDSLKGEGFNVEKAPNEPHITLIRSEELAPLIEKHKNKWQGACKNGMPVKFALKRIVHLVPSGWKDVNRVWFIEVESPDLLKYRTELGLPELPKAKNGNDHRFHITFAVSKNKGEVKRAYELLTEKRAAGQTGELTLSRPTNITDEGEGLNTTFARMGLDPDVTLATLGESHANVGTPVILRATKKLLNIQKGMEEVDDRDSLAFQTVYSPEDFFAERIRKDAGQVGRKLLWRSTLRGNLKHIPSGALTPQLQGVLLRSGMGMPLEEINPMDVFDQHLRVLRLGEGGITNLDAVPSEARNVQPSHFGYIDPIRAPECYDEKTEVFTRAGWKLWADITKEDEFACRVDGILEFHKASDLHASHYEGPMHHGRTGTVDYMVTPNHRMYFKAKWSEREYIQQAAVMFGRQVRLIACHLPFEGGNFEFSLPRLEQTSNAMKQVDSIDSVVWARFMGHYLADGSCAYKEESSCFGVAISAVKARKRELLDVLLPQTPWGWSYADRAYRCGNKQLAAYLKQLGKSYEKFIPEDLLNAPLEVREALFDALMASDGSIEGGHFDYVTTSLKFAKQVERLAIGLGIPAFLNKPEVDERSDSYHDCHRVRMLTHKYREVKRDQQEVVLYSGMVYCATVPGGLLYVRRERLPFWCGNSEKIGVDSRLAHGAFKGSDGKVYTDMLDVRTGKRTSIPAENAAKAVIAFPGEMARKGKQVRAMVNSRQVEYVDRGEVDYELLSPNRMFSATSNLVPLISGIKGGRLLMGAKFVAQALPLRGAEAPLVQNLSDIQGRSFDDLYGERVGAIRAVEPGVVEAVDKNGIKVRYKSGETEVHQLYNNFPFNRRTYIHNTPAVKVGDRVRPGDILASSNFTDSKGTLAIGTNLRTAYMPYKGLNYEDAIVISEGAAKRLASEHMYQHKLDVEGADMEVGRKQYISIYPAKYSREQFGSIDDQGVVKVGTKVKYGDPLVLSLTRTKTRGVHRGHKPLFSDASLTWGHESEGVVTDVDQTKEGGWNVTVKAYSPAQEGDKLAGRYGDKGVISKIVPDDQMPHGADNKPYEILLNPLGVISRGNPSQVFETLLGKVARKRGEAIKIPSFMDENLIDHVQKELSHAGLRDTDDLIDPETGRKIPGILTGERFIMKLHHTAESKGKGRDVGAYTSEGLPAKGGEFGCFWGHQKVRTMHGDVSIARLVEKRQSAFVWTYDESLQEWVYRPITDWFVYRASVNDLITVELLGTAASIGGKVSHRTCIYPTRNHVVFRGDGTKCLAGDLKPGDTMLTNGPLPTRDQMSLMLGSLLGDAHARPETFVDEHSCKQAAYVSWKQSVLAGLLAKTSDCIRKESMSSVVVKHRGGQRDWIRSRKVIVGYRHICAYLHRLCYTDGVKTINEEWLNQITPLGVAAWFLDDGSLTNSAKKRGQIRLSGSISTHAFTLEEVERLAHWLSKHLNASCIRRVSNNVLGLGVEACQSMIRLVAENVPFTAIPKSKMYLRASVEALQTLSPPRKPETICRLGRVPALVKSVKPYKHDKSDVKEINVYDITVDGTHTYTVGGVLVSNSKRISNMEINSLLSHGATEVLRDAQIVRGQRNDDYWRAFRLGLTPPSPKVPMIYDKFLSYLKGAGINIKKDGSRMQLFAMTDKDVDKITSGPVKNAQTVLGDTLKPIDGGLFDQGLTGGHGGNRWSHINLTEPVPNPVMEEPIRRLLGLTQKEYEAVIAGKKDLQGKVGGAAIKHALGQIRVDSAIEYHRGIIKDGPKSKRDNSVKVLGYLQTMQKNKLDPADFVVSKVPVLPTSMRPITWYRSMPLVADSNFLYRDLIKLNEDLSKLTGVVGDKQLGNERLKVYNAFKAISGLGDPVQAKTQEKGVRGLLKHIFGSSPKVGMFQRRVLGSPVDVVGRASITPNPDLNMDQVGIPEAKAWTIYRPFIMRRLVRSGMPAVEAAKAVANQTDVAKKSMLEEIEARPVIINRAPTLHRYGFMAAWPVLTKGQTLQIPPVLTPGFNADFDGDAMNYHVPVTDAAVKDAIERMMPSRNLKAVRDFQVHYLPKNEFLLGLYLASTAKAKKEKRVFRSRGDVIAAYQRGELSVGDPVVVKEP